MSNLFREIIVDNFAGGGGASTGIEQATGRSVDIAINHDPDAIAMHKTNHPTTEHYAESVWDINPRDVVKGRAVALVWLSPDCKHFSKAKGGKPVEKKIRGLAWVAVRWAATVKPRVIMLENVEEFQTWGPLNGDKPCQKRKGRTFKSFINALKRQGYQVDWKELRACDYGAPTIRKRLFLIARRDGQPITWPKPTHGAPDSLPVKAGKLLPYRTAAECIDWSIPCPSIFDRKRPLAENTMKRIARGIQKFVIDNPDPFIVTCNHSGEHFRGQSLSEPMKTITASRDAHGLVSPVLTPFITEHANASNQRNMLINEPLRTQCAAVKGGHFAVVAPVIARQFGNSIGFPVTEPVHTICAGGEAKRPGTAITQGLVTSNLIKLRGTNTGTKTDEPVPTITAGGLHIGEVRAFILKYYGTNIGHKVDEPLQTITAKHRFGLVTVKGETYQIVDIGMRMLQPHELFKAQGFPDDYIIDVDHTGKRYPKTKQVARCGNAVPPPFAEHLVKANLPEMCQGGHLYDEARTRRGEAS
ncbi:DNA cytosine methyltransferase [Methylophaga sp. OBS4]|uniref:DNA cytosine methyltransferase n=1 Tax=Methylophaga sp. OBS4 TaxID=2991935 RepID=UPI0022581D96|nr:DNA cytosine methyltransferase [Methylophaga sp. OBS4]MCX4186736.1 DNA cytosine methyltransferase [Methylophaga sp. OBS4]